MKNKIKLKELKVKDVTKEYVSWMNDKDIIRFTEISKRQTLKSIKEYVKKKYKSKNEYLYGIYVQLDDKNSYAHIGNIKLGPINFKHKFSEISYFIGDKKKWKKGYGTAAIKQITIISKKKFGLKKLQAGFIKVNQASKKVLINNNFKFEGLFKSQRILENKRYDSCWYGKII